MPKVPRVTAKKLLSALLRSGFYVHHQTGSHVNLRSYKRAYLHVVIPNHNNDLSIKTIKSIIAQAEITVEELVKLL